MRVVFMIQIVLGYGFFRSMRVSSELRTEVNVSIEFCVTVVIFYLEYVLLAILLAPWFATGGLHPFINYGKTQI